MSHWFRWSICGVILVCIAAYGKSASASEHNPSTTIQGKTLTVSVNVDGSYSIAQQGLSGTVVRSDVEADVDSHLLRSSDYPQHKTTQTEFQDEFGRGTELTVTNTGLPGTPDLICTLRLYRDQTWGDVEVKVSNTTDRTISVQAIRSVHAIDAPVVSLNGPASDDRVLSDSYSEDRPQLTIRDIDAAPEGMHRAVGSQLIYNRKSGESLFLGALTSDRLLTIFHLKEQSSSVGARIVSYDVVATGTTEIMKGESLRDSPASEQVDLSLSVKPGDSLSSERLMFAVGSDYHAQLEQYGSAIKKLHHARVDNPTPIGWWSWTAYYFGLNQGAAITNANWLAENLKQSGYKYFQIDEGYQYARGEYATPDAALFPRGVGYVGDQVRHNGLTFGVWTAPFEVSERAWVFQNHNDWLLHNAAGQLIHIGYVTDHNDPLYVLDTTNPGAQRYLRQTYTTLYNFGVRFIKMDFMDDSAVEGAYYKPNTTALEAQRIGLKIIRSAVGEDVVLDKDGSPMLNPVGIVDAGRISQDTGHTFAATRDAASGIAARYYMNRNFFIADPDAFTVSTQTVDDQSWHGGQHPLTFEEAKASIALSAVSGGMFEVGDDLPTLGASPERLALVKDTDLLDMARLGQTSTPVDLMTYAPSDGQPSIFLLKESNRQSILTIFNWTETARKRVIALASLGLKKPDGYRITEVFGDRSCCDTSLGTISMLQPPHSVRMFKITDNSLPETPPSFEIRLATSVVAGESLIVKVISSSAEIPVLTARWDFGDGSTLNGMEVRHAYTRDGQYDMHVTVTGLNGITNSKTLKIAVTGSIPTRFVPVNKKRPE